MKHILAILTMTAIAGCDATSTSTEPNTPPKKVIKPVSGIEIENNGSLLYPPKSPNPTRDRYW